ncbi:MAG: Nif3-like dinuclear metal center hexameric protein [Flavobacteriia bacterium]|nr:Nif3-like dinuclear metal center hexameric protein [Flavobacteriia bacterium]
MQIKELTSYLESLFPISSQADFDNCGLQVGSLSRELSSVLVCLDITEEIIEEAITLGSNLIISHHPIIFKGIKKISEDNELNKILIQAIKNDITLYSIHTNIDHSINGVNKRIAEKLNLENIEILNKSNNNLYKLVVFTPNEQVSQVENALFTHGAGNIGNYRECNFVSNGLGSYTPEAQSNPFLGEKEKRNFVDEKKIEVLVEKHKINSVVSAMISAHPYEEVAYDIIPLANSNSNEGSGMIGNLQHEVDAYTFLCHLKDVFHVSCIRHTETGLKKIKKVAFCGGAGIFLLPTAIQQKADIFITGDVKYHDFFMSEKKIIIADIGHYESEQFTKELICDVILKKFSNFAVHLTKINTNPVNYL